MSSVQGSGTRVREGGWPPPVAPGPCSAGRPPRPKTLPASPPTPPHHDFSHERAQGPQPRFCCQNGEDPRPASPPRSSLSPRLAVVRTGGEGPGSNGTRGGVACVGAGAREHGGWPTSSAEEWWPAHHRRLGARRARPTRTRRPSHGRHERQGIWAVTRRTHEGSSCVRDPHRRILCVLSAKSAVCSALWPARPRRAAAKRLRWAILG